MSEPTFYQTLGLQPWRAYAGSVSAKSPDGVGYWPLCIPHEPTEAQRTVDAHNYALDQLKAQIATLTRELASAKEDGELLDWLETAMQSKPRAIIGQIHKDSGTEFIILSEETILSDCGLNKPLSDGIHANLRSAITSAKNEALRAARKEVTT